MEKKKLITLQSYAIFKNLVVITQLIQPYSIGMPTLIILINNNLKLAIWNLDHISESKRSPSITAVEQYSTVLASNQLVGCWLSPIGGRVANEQGTTAEVESKKYTGMDECSVPP